MDGMQKTKTYCLHIRHRKYITQVHAARAINDRPYVGYGADSPKCAHSLGACCWTVRLPPQRRAERNRPKGGS